MIRRALKLNAPGLFMLLLATQLLVACVSVPAPAPAPDLRDTPRFALAPSLYQGELAVQQRLHFTHAGHTQTLDTYLEIDGKQVRMAALAGGQVAVSFSWDGATLAERRAPWMPPSFDSRDVLSDLQLCLWPVAALRTALPPGWHIAEQADGRRLLDPDGELAITVRRVDARHTVIEHPALDLKLEIESAADVGEGGKP